MTEEQQAAKIHTGYYGPWARCWNLSQAEVINRLEAGQPYTIRFRSPEGPSTRVEFVDLIRGRIEHQDNINDIVLLKSSDQSPRLPTYHFAHAVDDHLMRVNLVLRGEEWISSVPLHLQLFKALNFEPIPYAHIAPLMKFDGSSKRKLSKRDNEADVDFYIRSGYPAGAVQHYLRGLANSTFAEMTDLRFAPVKPEIAVRLLQDFADAYQHIMGQRSLVPTDPQLGRRSWIRTNCWTIQERSEAFCGLDCACEQCDPNRPDRTDYKSGIVSRGAQHR